MCTCDTDPRIRANHENFPQNCEHQAGFTGCGFGVSPSYAHPQGWTDPYGIGHHGEPHFGESFSGYEGEFPQGHTEPYGVRTMDPWSTSFTGADAADASETDTADAGDPAETSAAPVSDGTQVIVEQVPVAVSPRHVWRRRNGSTFSTIHGSPRDHRAKRAARFGLVTLVSGAMFTGAPIAPIPNEILFTVTNPGGAVMRWQDGSVQETSITIPYGTKFRGVLRPRELVEVTSPGFTGWVNVYETQQIGPVPSTRGDFYAGADPWGDLAPTCPPGKTWQANTLQCVPMIPAPQPEQLAQLHPVTKGYYAGADPWGDLAPTCPPGKTWQANTLQCVPSIPAPPPEQLAPLRPVATKGDFTGMGGGMDFGYPGGFPEWGYDYPGFWVGAAAGSTTATPAVDAQVHADNAKAQAQSAKEVAEHPTANAPAKKAANAAITHATQAKTFARAAAANPTHAAHYAHEAGRHATAAALQARRAHGHLHHEHGREGIFGHLFGRNRGRGFPRGRSYGRVGPRSRFFHSEWRGVGHPNWRRGIGARWAHHRAECLMRHRYGCLKERIYSPQGYVTYRVTPAGAMQGIQLEVEEQAANVQYVQTTGQQAPSTDDGPVQGSEKSADGSQTPAEGDAAGEGADDTNDADQDNTASDTADTTDADDTAADTSDTAATGEFTGWDMWFTDPYGNYDTRIPSAWNSEYAYGPGYPDPWGGWNW
jgi:hypothetical protein